MVFFKKRIPALMAIALLFTGLLPASNCFAAEAAVSLKSEQHGGRF